MLSISKNIICLLFHDYWEGVVRERTRMVYRRASGSDDFDEDERDRVFSRRRGRSGVRGLREYRSWTLQPIEFP
jgi:hypothetical protein